MFNLYVDLSDHTNPPINKRYNKMFLQKIDNIYLKKKIQAMTEIFKNCVVV